MRDLFYLQLGKRIKAAREAADLTQAELAARLKVSQPGVAHWELANRKIDIVELRALAWALQRPLHYFVEGASRSEDGDGELRNLREAVEGLDPKARGAILHLARAIVTLIERAGPSYAPAPRVDEAVATSGVLQP
jgi:transcriptional regulator with XRE-family HTH domain